MTPQYPSALAKRKRFPKRSDASKSGADPEICDILEIQMMRPAPHLHQQENHIIDDGQYWVKRASVSWRDLQKAVEDPAGPLWLNGYSSGQGQNDRVPEALLGQFARSLYLLRADKLSLVTAAELGSSGGSRRRVRAQFENCGHTYRLVVTDPWIERQCRARPDGETELLDGLLYVSLGEIFKGFAYKLVAAVITAQRVMANA